MDSVRNTISYDELFDRLSITEYIVHKVKGMRILLVIIDDNWIQKVMLMFCQPVIVNLLLMNRIMDVPNRLTY